VPRPHIAMRKIREVIRLTLAEGMSLRQVSASLGVPPTTLAEHVRRIRDAGLTWPLPADLDDDALEAMLFAQPGPRPEARPVPDWPKVHLELRRKGVTLMLLWHEYKQTFPDGYAYSQFSEHYRAWKLHLDVVMRQEHKAGEKMFVDFPGQTVPIYDRRGQVAMKAELFVAALGASGFLHCELFPSQELLHWVTAHVHAFSAFNGCPAIVVCDNLRSGVTRPHRYEPDVNASYSEMAAHYRVAIMPARSYKPRDKAKAEGGVLLAERWVMARLRDRHFTSLAEANEAIAELVAWLNNRPFKRLPGSRRSVFETVDRPALRPLPPTPYEFATWRKAKLGLDYHIEIRADRHFYSAPYRLVGQVVEVRSSAATVEVFYRSARVASHVRSTSPAIRQTRPTCPIPTAATRPGPRLVSSTGRPRRARPRLAWPKRCWPASPTPNRVFARASGSSAWVSTTAPPGSRPPAPGRSPCAATATARSSPYCAMASTNSPCSYHFPLPTPTTTTSVAPVITNRERNK
jgi:transposase